MSSTTNPIDTTTPAVPAAETQSTIGSDVNAMMLKMADQQQTISLLNEQLATKNEDVKKLSERSRTEMKAIYDTVISKWVYSNPI
jgi:uncharacterized coiled-coil protein SlyX